MRHLNLAIVLLLTVSCGSGSDDAGTEDQTEPNTSVLTTTTTIGAETTTSGPTSTTSEPTTTTTTTITTTTISAEQLEKAEAVGDIAAGEDLFFSPVEGVPRDEACSTCHTFDETETHAPSLLGISGVAGDRVEGLSDIEYLRQSIVDPSAFQDGDWFATMPYQYSEVLSEDQINNLVAFLLTK
jgi:mono/diheme cytochrome c family protein